MHHLFLDDERNISDVTWLVLPDCAPEEWMVVRNYDQFVQHITAHGLPAFVSFDHDLGQDPANPHEEKTGHDCAKWLVNYCLDNNLACPDFVVHSKNPEGAKNIAGLLNGFQRFQNQSTFKVKL